VDDWYELTSQFKEANGIECAVNPVRNLFIW